MALGIDMKCAEIVLEFKQKYKNLILECAIPCKNQFEKWSKSQQERYHKILEKADIINFVSNKEYQFGCMIKRNEYMVEKCDALIAVWNGGSSGTKETIKIARKLGKKVKIIDPNNPK